MLELIQQRLAIADDVARVKWNTGAAIEDPPRERAIIDAIGRQAPDYGLSAGAAQDFFRAQIEASKIVQRARFGEWRAASQPKFTNVRDLKTDIRPALDALTHAMLSALAAAMPALRSPGAGATVEARAALLITGAAERAEAVAPLVRISQPR